VHGASAHVGQFEDQLERFRDAYRVLLVSLLAATPGFRLAELPGAGHFANPEQPAAFEALRAEFLGATRDATRSMEVLGT
jgi:hypothetical protein